MSRSPKNKNINQCEYGCCGNLVRCGKRKTETGLRLKRQVKRAERQKSKRRLVEEIS
jgi:hypothetical protein